MPKAFSSFDAYERSYRSFLSELAASSPTLREHFVLGGSGPASIQYLKHSFSGDADFYTKPAFSEDLVNQSRKELMKSLGNRFIVDNFDPEYGFLQGGVQCKTGQFFELDLKCSDEDCDPTLFSEKGPMEGFDCQSLGNYINLKVNGCLVGRNEPKDLYHLAVAASLSPRISAFVRSGVQSIAKDPYDREALISNMDDSLDSFMRPDSQMAELMASRPGKNSVSREMAIGFVNTLRKDVDPHFRPKTPNIDHHHDVSV